jgi:hypothetical protein
MTAIMEEIQEHAAEFTIEDINVLQEQLNELKRRLAQNAPKREGENLKAPVKNIPSAKCANFKASRARHGIDLIYTPGSAADFDAILKSVRTRAARKYDHITDVQQQNLIADLCAAQDSQRQKEQVRANAIAAKGQAASATPSRRLPLGDSRPKASQKQKSATSAQPQDQQHQAMSVAGRSSSIAKAGAAQTATGTCSRMGSSCPERVGGGRATNAGMTEEGRCQRKESSLCMKSGQNTLEVAVYAAEKKSLPPTSPIVQSTSSLQTPSPKQNANGAPIAAGEIMPTLSLPNLSRRYSEVVATPPAKVATKSSVGVGPDGDNSQSIAVGPDESMPKPNEVGCNTGPVKREIACQVTAYWDDATHSWVVPSEIEGAKTTVSTVENCPGMLYPLAAAPIRGGVYHPQLERVAVKEKHKPVRKEREYYAPKQLTGFLRIQAAGQAPSPALVQSLFVKGRRWLEDVDTSGYAASDLSNHLWQAVGAALVPPKAASEMRDHWKHQDVVKLMQKTANTLSGDLGKGWSRARLFGVKIPIPIRRTYALPAKK